MTPVESRTNLVRLRNEYLADNSSEKSWTHGLTDLSRRIGYIACGLITQMSMCSKMVFNLSLHVWSHVLTDFNRRMTYIGIALIADTYIYGVGTVDLTGLKSSLCPDQDIYLLYFRYFEKQGLARKLCVDFVGWACQRVFLLCRALTDLTFLNSQNVESIFMMEQFSVALTEELFFRCAFQGILLVCIGRLAQRVSSTLGRIILHPLSRIILTSYILQNSM
ncbi:hypothetical protein [Simkania sp.]|uniref:hypothetical protein n=1 Tax=Simkania sp. TaxID=34094 RepID=UPI003B52EFF1